MLVTFNVCKKDIDRSNQKNLRLFFPYVFDISDLYLQRMNLKRTDLSYLLDEVKVKEKYDVLDFDLCNHFIVIHDAALASFALSSSALASPEM